MATFIYCYILKNVFGAKLLYTTVPHEKIGLWKKLFNYSFRFCNIIINDIVWEEKLLFYKKKMLRYRNYWFKNFYNWRNY